MKHTVMLPTDKYGSEPDPMTIRAEIFPPDGNGVSKTGSRWGEPSLKAESDMNTKITQNSAFQTFLCTQVTWETFKHANSNSAGLN